MEYEKYIEKDIVVFSLSGKLFSSDDISTMRSEVRDHIANNHKYFVLDMADVPWINSDGIGLIAVTLAMVSEIGGRVVLASISPKVKQVLTVTKCDKIIQVFENREQALASFESSS